MGTWRDIRISGQWRATGKRAGETRMIRKVVCAMDKCLRT